MRPVASLGTVMLNPRASAHRHELVHIRKKVALDHGEVCYETALVKCTAGK